MDDFAGIFRSSFFVSLYSFLEARLISECRSRKSDEILLDLSDLQGQDGIEKVKVYFTKVLRGNFPSNTPEWVSIKNYNILRNCIIHAQGRINELRREKDQEILRSFLKNKNVIVNDNGIYLNQGFCEEACRTIEKFLLLALYPAKEE